VRSTAHRPDGLIHTPPGRPRTISPMKHCHPARWLASLLCALTLLGGCANTTPLAPPAPRFEPLTVKQIGEALMTNYVWPLQCVGLLLTVALIGALVLVMEEKR